MGSSFSKKSKARKSATRTQPQAAPTTLPSSSDGLGKPFRDPKARDNNLPFPLDGRELSSVSHQELTDLLFTGPKLHEYGAVTIVRPPKSLVLKGGRCVTPSEARNMILASQSLHLPVPKVHRTFTADIPDINDKGKVPGHFIVMDYIPGPTVEGCWDDLDQSQRESIIHQVVTSVNTMQSTPLDLPPGPVGATTNEIFEGPWFTEDGAGPFSTLPDLENWYNHKVDICIRNQQLAPNSIPRFKFDKLVLTHQDIAARNLILDATGKLWVIDWGIAGIYPPGFFKQAVLATAGGELAELVLAGLEHRGEHMIEQYRDISYGLTVAARRW